MGTKKSCFSKAFNKKDENMIFRLSLAPRGSENTYIHEQELSLNVLPVRGM